MNPYLMLVIWMAVIVTGVYLITAVMLGFRKASVYPGGAVASAIAFSVVFAGRYNLPVPRTILLSLAVGIAVHVIWAVLTRIGLQRT
jgi:hypothetical protein